MNFYLLSLIPIILGGILWIFHKKVVWQEWLIGAVLCLIMAVTFHVCAIKGMTDDQETWSGQITNARQYSRWQEYYEYAVYRTEYYTTTESYTYYTGSGKNRTSHRGTRTVRKSRRVFDHWQPTTRWHEESWRCNSDIGTSYAIDEAKYNYFCKKYNKNQAVAGDRTTGEHNSKMIGGDPNDYVTDKYTTGWVEPITVKKSWENRVKAAPSVFSFANVPTNIPVFSWPENPHPFQSQRVMGYANKYISTLEWDKLNAELGPIKKVNLIIVGFQSDDSMLGQYQQAKWIGGRKNDLVITVGGQDLRRPSWCFVFGWTDSAVCKQTINSYIMKNGVTPELLGFLNQEIKTNYKIKDWHQFDYLRIEPAARHYYWFLGVMLISQIGLYVFFHYNEFDKLERPRNRWGLS